MHNELIVPLWVSVGLIALMAKGLTFPALKLQPAHANRNLALKCAGEPEAHFTATNLRPSITAPAADDRSLFIEGLCRSLSRYQDIHVALADNYTSRACDETQSIWEFTNYWYGFKAAFDFDPDHPTSLIYQRDSEGEYHLIGAAFTAPERFTPQQRCERIADNIAEWQPHGIFGWVAQIYFHSQNVEERKAS